MFPQMLDPHYEYRFTLQSALYYGPMNFSQNHDGMPVVVRSPIDEIRPGDVVTEISEQKIQSYQDIFDFLFQTKGTTISIDLIRDKKPTMVIVINPICKEWGTGTVDRTITSLLWSGTRIDLLVGSPKITEIGSEQLKPSDRIHLAGFISGQEERKYGYLSRDRNFSLVTRTSLPDAMREIDLSQSGITGTDNAIRLGKMTGANFYLDISYTYTYMRQGRLGSTLLRLVDLQKGTILASDERTRLERKDATGK